MENLKEDRNSRRNSYLVHMKMNIIACNFTRSVCKYYLSSAAEFPMMTCTKRFKTRTKHTNTKQNIALNKGKKGGDNSQKSGG